MDWMRRPIFGWACLARNPVGPGGLDGSPGYVCTRRHFHFGPHAWVGHETTPNAVWSK